MGEEQVQFATRVINLNYLVSASNMAEIVTNSIIIVGENMLQGRLLLVVRDPRFATSQKIQVCIFLINGQRFAIPGISSSDHYFDR